MSSYRLSKIVFTIFILAVVAIGGFNVGQWLYNQGYKQGYNSSFFTLRVTHVEQQDDTYLVMIRDQNDELYTHYCYK